MRKFSIALTLSILSCTTIPLLQIDRATSAEQTSRDATLDLGVQQYQHGEYDRAIQTYQRVFDQAKQQNDQVGMARSLTRLSEVYNAADQGEKSLSAAQQALSIWKTLRDRSGEADALSQLAKYYNYFAKKYDRALETLQRSLELNRQVNDRAGEGRTLSILSTVYRSLNQFHKALETAQTALSIHQEVKDQYREANTLLVLSTVYSGLNDSDKAQEAAEKALLILRATRSRALEFRALS